MIGKIKWDYISKAEKEVVFDDLKLFNEERASKGSKNREILIRLFNYYNDYVSFKYPKVGSSMSCGKCVTSIVRFFTNSLEEYEKEES